MGRCRDAGLAVRKALGLSSFLHGPGGGEAVVHVCPLFPSPSPPLSWLMGVGPSRGSPDFCLQMAALANGRWPQQDASQKLRGLVFSLPTALQLQSAMKILPWAVSRTPEGHILKDDQSTCTLVSKKTSVCQLQPLSLGLFGHYCSDIWLMQSFQVP